MAEQVDIETHEAARQSLGRAKQKLKNRDYEGARHEAEAAVSLLKSLEAAEEA